MNSLNRVLLSMGINRLSLKAKIWGGFALVIFFLVLVSVITASSLTVAQRNVDIVVNQVQPLVQKSTRLSNALSDTTGALGYYLLSKESVFREQYVNGIATVETVLAELKQHVQQYPDEKTTALINEIEKDIQKFVAYREEMLQLAENEMLNKPGVAYSAQNMNPLSQEILQLMTQSILSEMNEPASESRRNLLNDLHDMRYAWANVMNGARAFLAFRGENSINEYKLYFDLSGDKLKKVHSYGNKLTLDQLDATDQLKESRQKFGEHFNHLIKIHGGEDWRKDVALIRGELGLVIARVKRNLEQLVDNARNVINAESSALFTLVSGARASVMLLVTIGVIAGVFLAWAVNSLITGPINQAVAAMNDIAEGEGDLTRRLNVNGRDEVAQLSIAFNKFIEKIQSLIRDVAGSTTQLSTAAEAMVNITNETSHGVSQQQTQTEMVAAAITEMAHTVQEVALNTEQASAAAMQANQEASKGKKIVADTMGSIKKLAGEVEKAASVIQQLDSDSDSIGGVLEVIQGIAEQTNLLALNAAIEAARAGEQGRGFAVVADEVRTLASRTQDSTQEIKTMIEKLQSGAQRAVEVMQEGKSQASATVDMAARADAALAAITSEVDQISQMNAQIAEAARQQGTVAEEVNENVVNITHIAETTSSGAQQLASSGQELKSLANSLQAQIGHFKI